MEIITKYYFNWKDLIVYKSGNTYIYMTSPFLISLADTEELTYGWAAMLSQYCISTPGSILTSINSSEVKKLLAEYILPRVWDTCAVISSDDTMDNLNNDISKFVLQVSSYLLSTKDYYKTIIDTYNNNLNALMEDITSTNTGNIRFNDMPQTEYVNTDDHLTNITHSDTTVTDQRDTKIARIAEIRDKLDNTYRRWSDEFIAKFNVMEAR